ncbi:MAG: 30S ribosomal protein S6 [Caldilineaceae bacterium]|nr:30S ribosomal protein S6 [Caldilineaceae bacterium]MCB0121111.1 30S ribosomal protein S6 [Caldilineaceae bacterium]
MSEVSTEIVHEYETVYIVQPNADEEAQNAINERFTQLILSFGGEVVGVEPWGRRTLAYPIDKFFEGYYILTRFTMRPAGASELDRFLRLHEDVIRYLVIRTNE